MSETTAPRREIVNAACYLDLTGLALHQGLAWLTPCYPPTATSGGGPGCRRNLLPNGDVRRSWALSAHSECL